MLRYFSSSYWNGKSMARSPAPAHPLSTTRTDYAPSRGSEEFPRKEAFDVTVKPVAVDQHAGQELSALRPAREQSRSRRGTPAPTLTQAEANEAVPQMPEPVQMLTHTRPRGYSTTSASRRDFDIRLSVGFYNHIHFHIHIRFCYADSPSEAMKKNGLLQHRVQGLLDEKSKVLTQLDAAQKKATENEQAAAKKIADLEAANRKKDDELRVAQSRLRASEEKQSNLSKLLEVRTADLNGVERFLTTADAYSGAEIIAMVETLNAEIFQTAAYMAELIEDESMAAGTHERMKNVERNRQMLEGQLRHDLGEDLWQYFQKKYIDIRREPLPLQLAFQCILSMWSTMKIRTFLFGHFGDQLDKVYKMIRESEAQAVAGRWRALTNAQLNSLKDDYPPNVVVDILLNMLFFCGWSASSDKAKKAMLLMQQMVFNIEKMANQIKVATKEGITTADLDVFVVQAGEPLKDGMEDIYSDNAGWDAYSFQMNNKRVLCTVGMGLRRTTVKLTEGRPPEYKGEILLKPKVALVSVLDSTRDGMELIKGRN
ncbi:hypothetical protein BDN70DRAFT_900059 [Pholiota conissans]|uniref:Uncharacterized protein n=1 Tax=Pholiota conissans TaxID=109636 RepID=A0A9P5YQV3_9AGAR|nr:hypothetical protein BDN70DRAFT_900059 [Pholiota conissans]